MIFYMTTFLKSVFVISFTVFFLNPLVAFAHPGGTDSSGCHTCRTNCANWGLSTGEYHCHNSKGLSQPTTPIRSHYGAYGTGTTEPWPAYSNGLSSYTSTVSYDSLCWDQLGYSSSYDSSDKICKCDSGYVIGTSGKCVNGTLHCNSKYGVMSQYNSSTKSCECLIGYTFNGSSCVLNDYSSYSANTYTPSYSSNSYSEPKIYKTSKGVVCKSDEVLSQDRCMNQYTFCKQNYGTDSFYSPSTGKCVSCPSGYKYDLATEQCKTKESVDSEKQKVMQDQVNARLKRKGMIQ